ncbi:MAG: rRNA maturation RNase YbeY [bacterium]|nr:rRNA maturation RNase YbeY [bacterium]
MSKPVREALRRRTTETSLVFLDDRSMLRLNKLYRGKKTTTNVLSFSFVRPPNKIAAGSVLLLGEILISPKQAALDARRQGHTLADEIVLLFLHGLLHVLGFDHELSSAKKKVMRQAEQDVIAQIPRLKRAVSGDGLLIRELVYPGKK